MNGHEDAQESGAGCSGRGGVLIANKPSGVSSRAVVDRVGRLVPELKVGHAGTLDPLATGVLILCVGPATRLVQWIHGLPKTYRTVFLLGARSDTLDAAGRIEPEADPRVPSVIDVEVALAGMVGEVIQRPPAYSALKIRGRRAYDLARMGRPVDPAPRTVRINRIDLLRYEWPHLELEIDCGAGTYIRSIARDIGEALRCGGLMETLVRTRIGPFSIDQAADPAELSSNSLWRHLRPALDAVADLPRITLDRDEIPLVASGRRILPRDPGCMNLRAGQVALVDSGGWLVAIAESLATEGWVQPRKVLWQ
jgi:tRNA pseudouridine55 synthase